METIRASKLCRECNIPQRQLQDLFESEDINPTTKFRVFKDNEITLDLETMSINELIECKNDVHRFINAKLEDLQRQVDNPDLSVIRDLTA